MIPVEKLEQVKRIVSHDNCADGTTSAMILRLVLPEASVELVQYGTDARERMVAEPGLLFCDMSPPESRAVEFLDAGALVLDHHAKCKATILRFVEAGQGAFGDEEEDPGVGGALLAFRHVWLPLAQHLEELRGVSATHFRAEVEDLAILAGIYDTWQTKHPRWIEAQQQAAAIKFWGPDRLVGTSPSSWGGVITLVGERAYERRLEDARNSLERAFYITTSNGLRAVAFNGIDPTSDAAEMLREHPEHAPGPADLLVGFALAREDGRPKVYYSTRTVSGWDVGAFCKAQGGGGHSASAGFNVEGITEEDNPLAILRQRLEELG